MWTDNELFLLAQNVKALFAGHLSANDLYAQSQRYLEYVSANHKTIGGIEVRLVDPAATICLI